MKNAEEWWIEGRSKIRSEKETINLLKQIQIDALKEAAEIARQSIAHDLDCNFVKHKRVCCCRVGLETASVHDAILTRIRELEADTKKEGR